MLNFADPNFRELNELNRRAQEVLDKGDFASALTAFDGVKERACLLGVDASWASSGLAICHDNLGDLELVFQSMCESLQVDPLNSPSSPPSTGWYAMCARRSRLLSAPWTTRARRGSTSCCSVSAKPTSALS